MFSEQQVRQKLKELRIEKGITEEQAANYLGRASNSSVNRIESGQTRLNFEIIEKLCTLYKVNPIDLFHVSKVQTPNMPVEKKGYLDRLMFSADTDASNEIKENVPKKNKPKKNIIKINDEKLKEFFAKHAISINTDLFQEKFKEIQEMFGADKLESYLSFLMRYTENESKKINIKNVSGFFVSLFRDDAQIDSYLYELEKESKKLEEKKIQIENRLESKIKENYEKAMSTDFDKHLIDNIEKLESKFIKIVNKHITEGFPRDYMITKKNKGIVDKTLLLNYESHVRVVIVNELKPYQKEFGYRKPSFEEWKSKTIDDEYLNQVRSEIEKTL